MKFLALSLALLLHATGLWPHLSENSRANISAAATRAHGVIGAADIAVRPITPGPLPVQAGSEPLDLSATGAFAIDTATGTVLFAKNAGKAVPIASVTKLVTCLVVLSRHSVDEKVTVPKLPTYQTADELMGLQPGETYRLGDLVVAALVQSANDAADTLALYDAGTTAKFATRMNAKMDEWGITDARFSNPTGLVDTGNSASPAALAKIAQLALTNPDIRDDVKLTEAHFSSTAGRQFNLTTTDQLLASGQFYGIKTGYTPAAGECFVGLTRIAGHEVVTVVLGANDRFGDTQTLANWIGRNWQWL